MDFVKNEDRESRIIFSILYECYICTFFNMDVGKWNIKKCSSMQEAEEFANKNNNMQQPTFWWNKDDAA